MSWQLIKITATSSHPVRNSRNELISGEHTLWDQSDPSKYKDDGGSLQPNVYGYAFNSPVGVIGYVNVTVMPLKRPADVPTVFLVGTINGTEVFKSAQFKFTAKEVVRVPVITPKTSAKPFSWNADVVWTMVSIKSGQLPCSGPGTTRLELYWIASTVHIAFQPSIPIDFLRKVLGTKPVETSSTFYQDMTNKVFKNFNKSYDTFHGTIHPVTHIDIHFLFATARRITLRRVFLGWELLGSQLPTHRTDPLRQLFRPGSDVRALLQSPGR